ncbi:PfkB family carbohydrate kinase [Anaerococcus jeddahensis]|uniref:PfkB family carbohydrate kinase n=1 Tax=Anaerococcus jeddahensis TaxID=1673719 RepID=UPI0006725420|nr:PfkB family carbohydrate kinase [Anaerococcus jeddahensis]
MKILNFGSVNIDLNFKVDHIVRPGETISSTNFTKSPGGKGLNQSIALSKVNENVYHAGKYGQDGEFIKKILEDNGISTNFLEKSQKNTKNGSQDSIPNIDDIKNFKFLDFN